MVDFSLWDGRADWCGVSINVVIVPDRWGKEPKGKTFDSPVNLRSKPHLGPWALGSDRNKSSPLDYSHCSFVLKWTRWGVQHLTGTLFWGFLGASDQGRPRTHWRHTSLIRMPQDIWSIHDCIGFHWVLSDNIPSSGPYPAATTTQPRIRSRKQMDGLIVSDLCSVHSWFSTATVLILSK